MKFSVYKKAIALAVAIFVSITLLSVYGTEKSTSSTSVPMR
ncbi:MAG: hypothetical protein WCD89_16415 [Anaerocolumna sp.]